MQQGIADSYKTWLTQEPVSLLTLGEFPSNTSVTEGGRVRPRAPFLLLLPERNQDSAGEQLTYQAGGFSA